MKYILFFSLISVVACVVGFFGQSGPCVGSKAPNFTLYDEKGVIVSLAQFQGQRVALMFYPSITTPYCTKEVCSVANSFDILKQHKIIVLGISYNSLDTNKEFSARHHVNFPLLYDKDKVVTKAYGVYGWIFPSRKTFLINEQGIIVEIIHSVNIENHAQQIVDNFSKNQTL